MKLKPIVASLVVLGMVSHAFAKSNINNQESVVDQNSIMSSSENGSWHNKITVGGIGTIVGIAGDANPFSSFADRNRSTDLTVNNFNVLVNANPSSWSKVTVNLGYLEPADHDRWSKDQNSLIELEEGYVTLKNFSKCPVYFIIGKKYLPFGDYIDPYIPYQIMSPTQMMTQTQGVASILGVSHSSGLYANVFGFRGMRYPNVSTLVGDIKNFGGKVGYYDNLDKLGIPNTSINLALSYIYNIWDATMFQDQAQHKEKAVDAISAHSDLSYKNFTVSANFVTTIKKINSNKEMPKSKNNKVRLWTADVNTEYGFKTFGQVSNLGAGIQWTGKETGILKNKQVFAPDYESTLPSFRMLGEYKIKVIKNTDLGIVVAHSKNYKNSEISNITYGLAKLTIQL